LVESRLTKSEIFCSLSRSIRSQSNVSLRVVESGKTVATTERVLIRSVSEYEPKVFV
jgi:hypothetical protein